MKCYTHSEVDAVGVCRACGRALCRDCVTEVSGICYCKGRCESSIKTNDQIQAEVRALAKQGWASVLRTGWVNAVLAALLLPFGILAVVQKEKDGFGNFMLLIGIVTGVRAFYSITSARRARKDGPVAKDALL